MQYLVKQAFSCVISLVEAQSFIYLRVVIKSQQRVEHAYTTHIYMICNRITLTAGSVYLFLKHPKKIESHCSVC